MKKLPLGRWTVSQRVVDHSIQGLLIFASVFLAFWLNDYRVEVAERRATEDALAAAINEVETNREILARWAPYHAEISRSVEAELAADAQERGPFNPYAYMDERGIFREILTYDSWEIMRQSGVRLDLEIRLAVNRVFQQQQYVEKAVRATVGFLGSRELFDPELAEENRVIFYRLVTELHAQEEAMLESYSRFLDTVASG